MSRDEIIKFEDEYLAKVYHKRSIVVAQGKDSIIWDVNGKQYVDCMAGYGAAFVGHSNTKIVEAIKKQAEKLISCHCSLYNEARAQLLKRLSKIVPASLHKVFLSNSGAEAVEAALKFARKFTGKKEIIAMIRSYHGKTFGALSVTWNQKYRASFEPLIPNVKFVPFGDAEKVEKTVSNDTAAIIVEPIQGEAGVYIPPEDYLKQLREIADRKGLILIFDEVQTGFARTGKMFAFEHWNTIPDILCLAKSAGGGVPIGITMGREDIMSSLSIGEHSSTFGGNPLACAAASATIDVLVEEKAWEITSKLGDYFVNALKNSCEKFRILREVRGLGLMVAVELRFDVLDVIENMQEKGVIVLSSGRNILRFLPSYKITREQLNFVVEVLKSCLEEKEKRVFS
ncbi:MAG: aspartate aminotransferase family protein [Candidatus Bathyarchaeota archaeon]